MSPDSPPANLSATDGYILAGLALGLLVAMTAGAARGLKRGPVRALASVLALAVALTGAYLFGVPLGHTVFAGTAMPWLLRGVAGALLLGATLWLLAFGFIWWKGRSKNASDEPEHPVSGAIVGCWVGILWYAVGLAGLLALAGMGEAFELATAKRLRAPAPLRWPMRVKTALAAWPGTAPLARFNPVPETPKRILRKSLAVLHSPKAFRRLQNDEKVRAIASHPAFYPLVNDPEIRDIIRRQDAQALVTHPRVIALLADEDFQRRLTETDIEPLLDRALDADAH